MTAFSLDDRIARERPRIDAALDRAVALPGAPERVAGPVRYAVRSGGKRLRPLLCVEAYRAVAGEPPEAVYRLAASLELIHAYSLIHDDLPSMDDDDLRRGRPSTHVAFSVPAAIVAGAALIPLAAREAAAGATALGLGPGGVRNVVVTLCGAAGAGGMVGGQVLDLEAEGRDITLESLEGIHRRKTGALLAAAPVMGAIAAGADHATRDAMRTYGEALGLAFQIADDILDVTGSSAELGKTAGRDTVLDKATFPALAGLDGARVRAREQAELAGAALRAVGLSSEALEALAEFAVERDR